MLGGYFLNLAVQIRNALQQTADGESEEGLVCASDNVAVYRPTTSSSTVSFCFTTISLNPVFAEFVMLDAIRRCRKLALSVRLFPLSVSEIAMFQQLGESLR